MIEDAVVVVESESGRRRVRLGDFLSPAEIERADREAIAWIKAARHADVDGLPLRDRLVYRGDSLWWFVEVYLHRMRVIETLIRAVTASENLFAALRPRAVEVVRGDEIAREVLAIGARRHGAVYRGIRPRPWRDALTFAGTLGASAQFALRAVGSRLRHRPAIAGAASDRRPIAVFVHSAFWRDTADREAYVGPILRQIVAQRAARRMWSSWAWGRERRSAPGRWRHGFRNGRGRCPTCSRSRPTRHGRPFPGRSATCWDAGVYAVCFAAAGICGRLRSSADTISGGSSARN